MADLITIGIFYDGGYLRHVNEYYLQHANSRNRIDLGALHEFIRHEVSKREGVGVENTKIFDKCFFSGRFYTEALLKKAKESSRDKKEFDEKFLELLKRDRFQEDELMSHGIKTFYRPMMETEKGIDSLFGLEAYTMSVSNKYNYVVLITGDGDHVTLVTKLRPLECKTLLLGWDFSYSTPKRNEETYTIETGLEGSDPLIMAMFKPYEKKVVQATPLVVAETEPVYTSGRVHKIYSSHGLIEADGKKEIYPFHKGTIGESIFGQLKVNDRVEFIVGKNKKGSLVAKEVKLAKAPAEVST